MKENRTEKTNVKFKAIQQWSEMKITHFQEGLR